MILLRKLNANKVNFYKRLIYADYFLVTGTCNGIVVRVVCDLYAMYYAVTPHNMFLLTTT